MKSENFSGNADLQNVQHAVRQVRSSYSMPGARGIALFVALFVPLATVLAFGGVYYWGWSAAYISLYLSLLCIIWAQHGGACRPEWIPIMTPCLAFGGLVFTQWLFHLSQDQGETLSGLLALTACGCVCYLSSFAATRRNNVRIAGWTIWSFVLLVSIEALWQNVFSPWKIYGFHDASYANPMGPYVNHDHYAGCMVLLLPVSVAVWLAPERGDTPRWMGLLVRGIAPAIGVASVILSASRGGAIALLAEILLALGLFLRRKTITLRKALGTGIAILSVALLTSMVGWSSLAQRFSILNKHDPSALDRWKVALACLAMFRHFPWLGTGFNSFESVYPRFQTFDNGLIWTAAHNEYLQCLAEMGLVGIVLVIGFCVVYLLSIRPLLRKYVSTIGRTTTIRRGALIGVCGFLVHAAFDFQFHIPANALLFFLLVGLSLPGEELKGNSQASGRTRKNSRTNAICVSTK